MSLAPNFSRMLVVDPEKRITNKLIKNSYCKFKWIKVVLKASISLLRELDKALLALFSKGWIEKLAKKWPSR